MRNGFVAGECDAPLVGNRGVIVVGGSTTTDQRWSGADSRGLKGDCLSVLAPAEKIIGALNSNGRIYGQLSGTSPAAGITAGVAALILSARPELTAEQVRFVLQDTCDKIEPDEARYCSETGYSQPSCETGSTHGYGRLNAFEAVRLVAPRNNHGRGEVDVVLRDHQWDWGNTERASTTVFASPRRTIELGGSPDIKVVRDGGVQADPRDTAGFNQLLEQMPSEGGYARVYVRIRNRGPVSAQQVVIRLFAAPGQAAKSGATIMLEDPDRGLSSAGWRLVGRRTVPIVEYSGSSVALAEDRDRAQIAAFDWTVPVAADGAEASTGYALLAIATCDQDAVSSGDRSIEEFVAGDNNVTLKYVTTAAEGNSDQ